MRNKTFKRQLGVFAASFVLTACVIFFSLSFVTIEKNTGKMLGNSIVNTFGLDFENSVATVTVSDRNYTFSLETLSRAVTSKGGALLAVFLLVL